MASSQNRKKSFTESIKNGIRKLSGNSKMMIPDRSNGDQYHYIHNFAQVTDKDCLKFDTENDKIYRDHLKLFNKTNEKLETLRSPMRIDNKPSPPPRPNNYERLCEWRRQNVKYSAHDQSLSLLYLIAKGHYIKFPSSKVLGIQPYQTIKEAEKMATISDESMEYVVIDFLDNLNLKPAIRSGSLDNLLHDNKTLKRQISNSNSNSKSRKRSNTIPGCWLDNENDDIDNSIDLERSYGIRGRRINITKDLETNDISENNDNINNSRSESHSNKEKNMTTTTSTNNTPNLINVTNFHLPKDMLKETDTDSNSKEIINNQMKCAKPEHHDIDDKVQYFDNMNCYHPRNPNEFERNRRQSYSGYNNQNNQNNQYRPSRNQYPELELEQDFRRLENYNMGSSAASAPPMYNEQFINHNEKK